MDLWTSPTDRREPCGPCGQPVDNADALPTACPHSRASRPQAPQDQPPVILTRQHRTTLRRGCPPPTVQDNICIPLKPIPTSPTAWLTPIPSGSFPYGIRLVVRFVDDEHGELLGLAHQAGDFGADGAVPGMA